MPVAKLRLTIPEGIWVGELTRRYPEVTIDILAAQSDDELGVALANLDGPTVPEFLGDMEDSEEVTAIEVLQHSESEAVVQFETVMPLLLMPAQDSGVPIEMPFQITDGEVTWEVTAATERLSDLGDQLEAFGIPFTVEYVQQRLTDEQLLTDRQHRLVSAAVDLGYYDTPRECSLTELADEVGIAKSTASETLHRAEGTLIKHFVGSESLGTA